MCSPQPNQLYSPSLPSFWHTHSLTGAPAPLAGGEARDPRLLSADRCHESNQICTGKKPHTNTSPCRRVDLSGLAQGQVQGPPVY